MAAKALILLASLAAFAPGRAASPERDNAVTIGATADRVQLIQQCGGHRLETKAVVSASGREISVKLCSQPGASDADWVRTLEAGKQQIAEADYPPSAKQQLVAAFDAEIRKYGARPSTVPVGVALELPGLARSGGLLQPAEKVEYTALPPLPAPKKRVASTDAAAGTAGSGAAAPAPDMAVTLRCREPGDRRDATCDFFHKDTTLMVRAVRGLEKGATLRFLRRGDDRGEVALGPVAAGTAVPVRLPRELCRGVASTKVEIELRGPEPAHGTAPLADTLGPFGLRC